MLLVLKYKMVVASCQMGSFSLDPFRRDLTFISRNLSDFCGGNEAYNVLSYVTGCTLAPIKLTSKSTLKFTLLLAKSNIGPFFSLKILKSSQNIVIFLRARFSDSWSRLKREKEELSREDNAYDHNFWVEVVKLGRSFMRHALKIVTDSQILDLSPF